jgi:hypothetical protein
MTGRIDMISVGGRRRTAGQHLRLMLGVQQDVCSPYPDHLYWDMQSLLPCYGDLDDDSAYRLLIKHVVGSYDVALEKWSAPASDPEDLFQRLRDQPTRNLHVVALELLRREAEHCGARVAMDKSPDKIVDWQCVMQAWPEMKWLHMQRNPLDQAASMAEAIIYPHDPLLAADLLRQSYEAAEALEERHPDRILSVSYENFMEAPWETVSKVCDFAGLKPSQDMLGAHSTPQAKAFAARSDLWKSNDRAPDPANIGRGRRRLTPRQIAEIETLLRPFLAKNGYPPQTTEDVVITEARWAEARAASAAAGSEKWKKLAKERPQEYAERTARLGYFERCREELRAMGYGEAAFLGNRLSAGAGALPATV